MNDLISREKAYEVLTEYYHHKHISQHIALREALDRVPDAECDGMTNKEWVDFLSEQFAVSRTTAREMLHGLMKCKGMDNLKKQFNKGELNDE